MPFAVIHRGRIELRLAALRYLTIARLISARATATTWSNRGLRHSERAVHGGDLVVARLRAVIQRVGEGVFACAHRCLRTGHIEGRALARHKAVAGDEDIAAQDRRAVIDLTCIATCERHRTLGDRDRRSIGLRDVARRGDLAPHCHSSHVGNGRRLGAPHRAIR